MTHLLLSLATGVRSPGPTEQRTHSHEFSSSLPTLTGAYLHPHKIERSKHTKGTILMKKIQKEGLGAKLVTRDRALVTRTASGFDPWPHTAKRNKKRKQMWACVKPWAVLASLRHLPASHVPRFNSLHRTGMFGHE